MSLRVRPFEAGDLAACAALLAHSHSEACARESLGPARNAVYGDPRACLELLERFFGSGHADVVVAESEGRIVGYFAGERQMFSPTEFPSIYAEPRSVSIPLHGHAVADSVDATDAYVIPVTASPGISLTKTSTSHPDADGDEVADIPLQGPDTVAISDQEFLSGEPRCGTEDLQDGQSQHPGTHHTDWPARGRFALSSNSGNEDPQSGD